MQSSNSVKSSEKPLAKKGFCGTLDTQAICQYVREIVHWWHEWTSNIIDEQSSICLVLQLPAVSMFQTMFSTMYHFSIRLISKRKHCKLMQCLRGAYIIYTVFLSVLSVSLWTKYIYIVSFRPNHDSHLSIRLSI